MWQKLWCLSASYYMNNRVQSMKYSSSVLSICYRMGHWKHIIGHNSGLYAFNKALMSGCITHSMWSAVDMFSQYSHVKGASSRLKSQATRLFVQQLVHASYKWSPQMPHYWPCVREIRRSPVDSPHKGSIKRKSSCLDVITVEIHNSPSFHLCQSYWLL